MTRDRTAAGRGRSAVTRPVLRGPARRRHHRPGPARAVARAGRRVALRARRSRARRPGVRSLPRPRRPGLRAGLSVARPAGFLHGDPAAALARGIAAQRPARPDAGRGATAERRRHHGRLASTWRAWRDETTCRACSCSRRSPSRSPACDLRPPAAYDNKVVQGGDPARGRALVASGSHGCQACHAIPGIDAPQGRRRSAARGHRPPRLHRRAAAQQAGRDGRLPAEPVGPAAAHRHARRRARPRAGAGHRRLPVHAGARAMRAEPGGLVPAWWAAVLAGCSGPQSALDPAGPSAASIHRLGIVHVRRRGARHAAGDGADAGAVPAPRPEAGARQPVPVGRRRRAAGRRRCWPWCRT